MHINTVKLRYYATSLLCHPRYYTTSDRHQLNSIENIFTMPPLTLATMPHEVQYCCFNETINATNETIKRL